jgi:hypothetical protein
MKHRSLKLILAISGLIVAGVVLAPQLLTLMETRNAGSTRPSVVLSDLRTGFYVEVELPSSRVFVLRDFDDQIYVFSVPYSDTAYWLPEFDWSHPAIPCAEFAPDNKNGMLVVGGKFRCRLPDHGEFFRREHSWSYSGKNLGYRTVDLKIADHEITEDSVLLSRWR